ncbi:MAG: Hpt domain-containing protein [Lachnospiraceae bacterium]|nr:Hpt domain-containing protein [Lachnospiraceae bacterium]
MITIDKLVKYGANTEEALNRCYGNTSLYLKLVQTITTDDNIKKLKNALDNNDLDTAFQAAHALKGTLGNLSLTPLYEPTVEITELLRVKEEVDYTPYINKIIEKYNELIKLCD